jgi:hypothetical protein
MARAKKETTENKDIKYSAEYYSKPENWERVEEVLAVCYKKIEILNELKISDSEFNKLIISKGFNDFLDIREHYRSKLNTAIGIQFLKKINSGMASEKFLQFAVEKYFLPNLIRQIEEEKLSSDDGIVVEKPIFMFDDKDTNITLEFLTLQQQNNVEEELAKLRKEDEENDKN